MMRPYHTSNYRGVPLTHLSTTQIEVHYAGKTYLADGHMAAMKMVDDLFALVDLDAPKAAKPQSLARERYESAWHVKQSLRS